MDKKSQPPLICSRGASGIGGCCGPKCRTKSLHANKNSNIRSCDNFSGVLRSEHFHCLLWSKVSLLSEFCLSSRFFCVVRLVGVADCSESPHRTSLSHVEKCRQVNDFRQPSKHFLPSHVQALESSIVKSPFPLRLLCKQMQSAENASLVCKFTLSNAIITVYSHIFCKMPSFFCAADNTWLVVRFALHMTKAKRIPAHRANPAMECWAAVQVVGKSFHLKGLDRLVALQSRPIGDSSAFCTWAALFPSVKSKGLRNEWTKTTSEWVADHTVQRSTSASNCNQIAGTLLATTILTVTSSLLSVTEAYSLQERTDPVLHNINYPPHANAIRHNSNCHQLLRHAWQMKCLPKISSVARFCSSLSLAAFPFRIHCIRLLRFFRRRFVRLCLDEYIGIAADIRSMYDFGSSIFRWPGNSLGYRYIFKTLIFR